MVAAPGSIIAAVQDLQVTTVNPTDLPTEPDQAAHQLAKKGGDVVLFGPDVAATLALAITAELATAYPELVVVLIQTPSQELLSDALMCGVRDVIAPDAGNEEIGTRVANIATAVALRRSRLVGGSSKPAVSGGIISVMAAKGGVGKTTVAVNLAVQMARRAPNNVVLVDLDLMSGEVDLVLGLEMGATTATVATVATPGASLDTMSLKLSLSAHPSGLLVLPAPTDLIDADGVDPDLVVTMLGLLRESFDHVIIDTAPGAGAALAAAVEVADDLLAIASPDVGGLRSLRRNLNGLDDLGLTKARRHLILNRAGLNTGTTAEEVENATNLPIGLSIPNTAEIAIAANQRLALVEAYPKLDAARAFHELAKRFAGEPAGDEQPARHLGVA